MSMNPAMQNEDSITGTALSWVEQGEPVAVATVINTWGSSPRPVGSQMVINGRGKFEGSVSGGCIEAAAVVEAQEVLREAKPRRLIFGVSNESAWKVGFPCGGDIELLIENYTRHRELLSKQAALEAVHQAYCTVTNLADGAKRLIESASRHCLDGFSEDLKKGLQAGFLGFQSKKIRSGGVEYFLHFVTPGLQLIIIGAVHVAKPLAKMARMAGYQVVIIDPRSAFAGSEGFTGVPIIPEWPEKALEHLVLHRATAVVALSHHSRLDDPALKAALRSEVFYIGALGSQRSHALRLQRLTACGFSEEELRRIHGPVGLAIGARTPTEIAVSILAQIIQKKTNGFS